MLLIRPDGYDTRKTLNLFVFLTKIYYVNSNKTLRDSNYSFICLC